jgi:hypothetical protein
MMAIVSHPNRGYGKGQIGFVYETKFGSTRSRQQGKKQGVIQSGENRVLLLISTFLFSPLKANRFAAAGEAAFVIHRS